MWLYQNSIHLYVREVYLEHIRGVKVSNCNCTIPAQNIAIYRRQLLLHAHWEHPNTSRQLTRTGRERHRKGVGGDCKRERWEYGTGRCCREKEISLYTRTLEKMTDDTYIHKIYKLFARYMECVWSYRWYQHRQFIVCWLKKDRFNLHTHTSISFTYIDIIS